MLNIDARLDLISSNVKKDIKGMDGRAFGYLGPALHKMTKIVKSIFNDHTKYKEENEFKIYELEKRIASLEYLIKSNNKET